MNEREDEHGHAIGSDGQLVYDPRCYYCLNDDDDQQVSYVKVEFYAEGGS